MTLTSTAAALALLISFAGQEAAVPAASCATPRLPEVQRPVKPTRPEVPACVDEARNRHTCSNRVIRDYETRMTTYSGAFDAYVDAVNAYVTSLGTYVDEVNSYVQCEQRTVMPSRLITG